MPITSDLLGDEGRAWLDRLPAILSGWELAIACAELLAAQQI